MRHLLNLFDVSRDEIVHLLDEAFHLKAAHQRRIPTTMLMGRVLALVFEKPSLRTRVSFQAAMAQLGGSCFFFSGQEVGLGSRESIGDIARTMSQYVDGVVLRTFAHSTIEAFAANAKCPVINGLSDMYHPCQALADVFTMKEIFGDVEGRTIAFVGDGNNVARSLAIICSKLKIHFRLACPKGYEFSEDFLQRLKADVPDWPIMQLQDPVKAVKGADIVYTDVWTSMGQETEQEVRLKEFTPFQVNSALLKHAPDHCRIMHCLPARRGEEITQDVLECDQSVVFQQAGNRMHAQKALIQWLLAEQFNPSES